MLIIRDAQFRAFEEDILCRFVLGALRESHAREVAALGAAAASDLVTDAVAAGRAFGLTLTDDLLRWTRLTLRLGAGFATDARCGWVHEFLDDWDPDLGARVVRLEQAVRERTPGTAATP